MKLTKPAVLIRLLIPLSLSLTYGVSETAMR